MSIRAKLKNIVAGNSKRAQQDFITDIASAHSRGGLLIISWKNFTVTLLALWIGFTLANFLPPTALWLHNWEVAASQSFDQLFVLFMVWLLVRFTMRVSATQITVLHSAPTDGGPGERRTKNGDSSIALTADLREILSRIYQPDNSETILLMVIGSAIRGEGDAGRGC